MAVPRISQRHKVDLGLVPQTLNNANATGDYFDMRGYRKALAICLDGASVINKTTKVEFLQATDVAGTDAKVVTAANAATGDESSATSTAAAAKITDVLEATITLASMANGETVTITDTDGTAYVFTAHTDTTTAASREFKIDGTDAQDATALYGLLIDATYGVPGLAFTDGGAGAITVKVADRGEGTFSIETDAVTHCVPAIVKQLLYSEIDIGDLDLDDEFYFVAVKVTKAGNGIVGVALVRENAHYPPEQQVAAGTAI